MSLPIPPEGFERATGVVEGRRQCQDCLAVYPVVDHGADRQCPKCSSTNTTPVKTGN